MTPLLTIRLYILFIFFVSVKNVELFKRLKILKDSVFKLFKLKLGFTPMFNGESNAKQTKIETKLLNFIKNVVL